MKIEDRAKEIIQYLSRLQGDFAKFREEFALLGKHLGHVQSGYQNAERRLEQFSQKFLAADADQQELFEIRRSRAREIEFTRKRGKTSVRLSLFSRLTLGYLAIFLIVALASAYAVLQLRDFRNLTESILKVDNRILDHEKTLADLLLAQSRAEQKFTITKTRPGTCNLCSLKIDFDRPLAKRARFRGFAPATPVLRANSPRIFAATMNLSKRRRAWCAPISPTRRRSTNKTKTL